MLKTKRLAEPKSLSNNWRKWNDEFKNAKTEKDKTRIENRYRKKDVQEQLETMFSGKCAYCESALGVVDYAHIEHFRPKDTYPERMFLWRNLLLACTVCNGKGYKGTQFPLAAHGGPLINPCVDDPQNHFDFVYDPTTREARVNPKTLRGTTTEKTLGLNRDKLLGARSDYVRKLILIKIYSKNDPEAQAILQKAHTNSQPYLAFIKKYT